MRSRPARQRRPPHEEVEEALLEGLVTGHLHEIHAVAGALTGEVAHEGIKGFDVALHIALGQPEAAAFAGFDFGQLQFAFDLREALLDQTRRAVAQRSLTRCWDTTARRPEPIPRCPSS